MPTYFPNRIEPKWQTYWLENKTFRAEDFSTKPKYYVLDMFPYPSGQGLHVGHPEGYTATDILARFMRMRGYNVLHPMGWDAFGLPAEQHAVNTGVHPRENTNQNIDRFRAQIRALGFSYDWDREISTTDPQYYKWTQWIFLKLYNTWYDKKSNRGRPLSELPIPAAVSAAGAQAVANYHDEHRLAYTAEAMVNWCPKLGTVLANEEVINGRSERGDHPVERMPLRQWMLRITCYAERLLNDLDGLDWPEPIKEMQRHWIGRSEGAEVDFLLLPESTDPEADVENWFAGRADAGFPAQPDHRIIRVYTTRPDTLFGATYMVLAPEHPMVDKITTADQAEEVATYRRQTAAKSDLDRTDLAKEKTGVFTGAYAVNPANARLIPVWIADYVLMGYGTGAIMAVPAHDSRDFEFARRFDLDIVEVVADPAETPQVMLKAYEWVGNWERRREETGSEDYLKVAVLVDPDFDIDSFREDIAENRHDPLWIEVRIHETRAQMVPGQDEPVGENALAISYLDDDFRPFIDEYVTEHQGLYLFSLDPADDEIEVDEEEDPTSVEAASAEDARTQPHHQGHHHAPGEECGEECEEHYDMTEAYTKEGIAMDSGIITGLPTAAAKQLMSSWLAQRGLGRVTVNYKLRDWLFSRQRYWGEPFPILLDENNGHRCLEENELPLLLPEVNDFQPTGTPDPPLSKATAWLHVERDGQIWRRETNTMPQWAGSCWYFLRFIDPHNDQVLIDPAKEKYWMPVDLYVGGAEHAVLHLLYSRFWHKVLHDAGVVHTAEPFQRLVNQGMILGEVEYTAYKLGDQWISPGELVEDETSHEMVHKKTRAKATPVKLTEEQVHKVQDHWVLTEQPDVRVDARAFKMSKSRGNVVNPDQVVREYGADALRLYEMFLGPLEATKPWNMKGVDGVWRFLNRLWRLIVDERAEEMTLVDAITDVAPDRDQARVMHQVIRGVTQDIEGMRFNTAISKLMEFSNYLQPLPQRPRVLLETMVLLLSPFAPHLAEELWQALGHNQTLAYEPWPLWDEALCAEETIEVVLQINSKVRSRLFTAPDTSDEVLLDMARADGKIAAELTGKEVVKSMVFGNRKGKLVNFVVKG